MPHITVYEIFRKMFPQFAENVVTWFPNGRNSVRLRTNLSEDFVFTYHKNKDWRFETVESFIKTMKGEKKKK